MIFSEALLFLMSLLVTVGQQQSPPSSDSTEAQYCNHTSPPSSESTEAQYSSHTSPPSSESTEAQYSSHTDLTPRGSNQTVNNNHTFPQPKESNETVNNSHTISNSSNVHLQRLAADCRDKNFTYKSCQKIFCQPWEKCIHGNCVCKLPYQCPKNGENVCSSNEKKYRTYCQLKSVECSRNSEKFSHFGACSLGHAAVSWQSDHNSQGIVLFSFNQTLQELSICMNQKNWTMHEANVFCRQLKFQLGAEKILTQTELTNRPMVTNFMNWSNRMRCRGFETSLSECFRLTDIEKLQKKCRKEKIAAVKCYDYPPDKKCTNEEFTCVNGKCIPLENLCNGIDDCADLSDETCCKSCSNSHHCKSDICIPYFSRCDGEDDCLDGSDEKNCTETSKPKDHNEERHLLKSSLAKISCGISNVTGDFEVHTLKRSKRLVGGEEALQGQFPWQIAVYDGTRLNCGGVFIGGCWILTAAHCLRLYHMSDYVVRIAKYNKRDVAVNEEILPVEKIIIHHDYVPKTYQNDIALIKVVHVFSEKECIPLSHDVLPVCVPWSEYLFRPKKTCVISGWGYASGDRVSILRWAELNIFGNCSEIYKSDFYAGMECAGKMDGTVDACKGDSGGPLVCTDERNEAYVWGLVSWGEECGKYGRPGVYTKVSHYFEWISNHVGRALISKYNV
uniref:Complement component factor I n=1 Tax=Ginglymostoma cirratum TaxID=7801 RepID=B0LCZ9_GINCI|nr:complement component factor I [Ginglymostoma cirratum]